MAWKQMALAVSAAAGVLLTMTSLAPAAQLVRDVCVHEAARTELSPEPVMVGCAVRGCCAGCAADAAIDVRIDVDGDLFARVQARLEGTDAAALAASMEIEGAGARSAAGVELSRGTTWLRGLVTAAGLHAPRLRLLVQPDARELRAAASPPPPQIEASAQQSARPLVRESAADERAVGSAVTLPRAPRQHAVDPEQQRSGDEQPDEEPAQWQEPTPLRASFPIPARMTITVTQSIGPNVVARDRYELRLLRCPVQKPRTDRIVITSNDGGDEATILLHGARDGGCIEGELWQTRDVLQPGNLVSVDGCNSEIAVFSIDDAVVLRSIGPPGGAQRSAAGTRPPRNGSRTPAQPPESPRDAGPRDIAADGWSALVGERLEVALDEPPIVLPLRLWRIGAAANSDLEQRSRFETTVADMLLNQNRCGITTVADVESIAPALTAGHVAALTDAAGRASGGDCDALAAAMTNAGLEAGARVGVLYMDGWPAGAVACVQAGTVIIGAAAQPESLAHGLGHLLGLQHAPFPASDNLMQPHVAMRRNLTEGQCFRATLEPRSILNRNGLRRGPIRACDVATSRACPPPHWKDILLAVPEPPAAPEAAERVASWLECEDCEAGSIAAVSGDADATAPLLAAAVARGPSPARDDALRHHLTGLFLRLQAYARTHPRADLPWTLQQTVDRYRAAFDLLVRSRASQALDATGAQPAAPESSADPAKRETDRKNRGPRRGLFQRD